MPWLYGRPRTDLRDYARAFAEAGFVALIFDYRGFGESEGPKWRLIPLEQADDIRNSLTWLETQSEVDTERLGLWGTSFGGAHVPYVMGMDSRVKAAVAQVGFDTGERFYSVHAMSVSKQNYYVLLLKTAGCAWFKGVERRSIHSSVP